MPISATSTCLGGVVPAGWFDGLLAPALPALEAGWPFRRRLTFFFAPPGVLVLVVVMDRVFLSTVIVVAIGFPFDEFDG